MKRINATEPYWNGSRWIYTPFIDGKQLFFSSTKKGAEGKRAVLKKYSKQIDNADPGIRFSAAWEQHLSDRLANLGAESESYLKSESIGRIHLLPRLKKQRVYSITEQDWQNCISLAKSNKVEQLSKKSLSNIKNEIMLFCKFAKKNRWIDTLPDSLTVPKTAPKVGKKILHPDELKILLSDSDGDWYINAWRLMVVTGLRPGEVYGLKWEDVQDKQIRIRRSINSKGHVTGGKNENAVRTLYSSGIATAILLDQKNQLKKNGINSEWIFCDKKGVKPKAANINNHWARYRTKMGFDGIAQYGLRHTFVSVSKSGLPEAYLKQIVGHSKSMDTLGIYGKEIDSDKVQAANLIDGIFGEYKTIAKVLHPKKQKA
jgi:integrase